MDINVLRFFLKVAELRHLTRAAEECFISQGAMSQAMHSLEEELNTPLFERKGRNIALNRYGELFYEYAKAAVDTIDEGRQALDAYKERYENTINLYAPTVYGFPGLANQIFATCEGVNLSMVQMAQEEVHDALRTSKLDLAISQKGLPPGTADGDITALELRRDPAVVLFPKGSRAFQGNAILPSQLEEYDFVSFRKGSGVRDNFDNICKFYGISPQVTLEVSNYADLSRAVATGRFLALVVPQVAINYEPFGVQYLPVAGPQYKIPIWIMWNNKYELKNTVKRIKNVCIEYFREDHI